MLVAAASSVPAALPVQAVTVVIPAHDEQDLLGACLASVASAARHPVVAPLTVRAVLVLDECTDTSADVAAAAARSLTAMQVLTCAHRSAALARRTGCEHALTTTDVRAARHWLAWTDADSTVPPEWLAWHVTLACAGADLVAGTVTVAAWSPHRAEVRAAYDLAYEHREGHPHAYGANLGIRGSALMALGGVPGRPLRGGPGTAGPGPRPRPARRRDLHAPFVTSARTKGRAPHGSARYLLNLDEAIPTKILAP